MANRPGKNTSISVTQKVYEVLRVTKGPLLSNSQLIEFLLAHAGFLPKEECQDYEGLERVLRK